MSCTRRTTQPPFVNPPFCILRFHLMCFPWNAARWHRHHLLKAAVNILRERWHHQTLFRSILCVSFGACPLRWPSCSQRSILGPNNIPCMNEWRELPFKHVYWVRREGQSVLALDVSREMSSCSSPLPSRIISSTQYDTHQGAVVLCGET